MIDRIIIADNQYITSEGIRSVIAQIGDINVSKVSCKQDLITELAIFPQSAIILDYTLFDFSSSDELCNISLRFKKSRWLLFSAELSDEFMRRIYFSSSNIGILYKDSSSEEVRTAITETLKGNRFVCGIVSNILLNNFYRQQSETEKDHLTATEKEILIDIASGKTTKEIAEKRHSSMHTIISHRKNIFRKTGVNNIYEATKYAVKAGLIDLSDYFI